MEIEIKLKPEPKDLGPSELSSLVPYKIVRIKNENGHNAALVGDIVIKVSDIWHGYVLFNLTQGLAIKPDYRGVFEDQELLFRRAHEVQEIKLFSNYEERP